MKIIKPIIVSIALIMSLFVVNRAVAGPYWEPTINGHTFKGKETRPFILIETQDCRVVTPNANDAFSRQMNETGYTDLGCVGSVREFLIDNSGGKFEPTFVVMGPVMLPLPMYVEEGEGECYHRDNGRMIGHAVEYANKMYPDLDFNVFDNDKSGEMDPVFVCYPTSGPHVPWPHASGINGSGWTVNGFKVPGLPVGNYAIGPERSPAGTQAGYSLFLHEFGHTLGLPDDYSGRLGKFSIYCDGTFDGGIIPVNFSAAERLILGWLDYEVIDHDGEYTLESLSKNKGLMLKTDNPDEYFLFSYRDNSGVDTPWDSKFAFGGMLVWHIDRSQNTVTWTDDKGNLKSSTAMGMWHGNAPNGAPDHPCHKLIDADGQYKPYASDYRGSLYFPGTDNVTRLNSSTHPHFKSWDGNPLNIDITNIRKDAATNTIKFNVAFEGMAALKVNVVDKQGGTAQTNAYISLAPVNSPDKKVEGNTELIGNAIFTSLEAGEYQIIVDRQGYKLYMETITIVNGSSTITIKLDAPGTGGTVESIDMGMETLSLATGESYTVHPVVKPLDVANRSLTWESSDSSIARVEANGTVRGVSSGTTTITATSVQTPSVSASFTVNVSFGTDNIAVTPFQRDAKVSWPGYNPDIEWVVRFRTKGAADYVSTPAQSATLIYLRGLSPGAEYEGIVETAVSGNVAPVTFSFTTNVLTSDFPVIGLTTKRFKVGDTIPLIASNITAEDTTVKWKINKAPVDSGDYKFTASGKCELRAEITYSDGSTDVLIKDLEIAK